MTWDWKVGDKAVCVRVANSQFGEIVPKPQLVYSIRSIRDFGGHGIGFQLNEILNAPRHYTTGCHEAYFNEHCFKPLTSSHADLFVAIAKGVTDGKFIVDDGLRERGGCVTDPSFDKFLYDYRGMR